MPEPLRLLIVEDSPADAELLALVISRAGFSVDWRRAESADELRQALAEGGWQIVLSDFSMPGFGAMQALEIVRQADPDLPFVVVSGTIGEGLAVSIMRAGANDYLLKDNLARLPAVVERELREAVGRRAARRAELAARFLAAIVQSSQDAIIGESLDGTVTSWNPAAERLFGWTAEEALGQSIPRLIVPPGRVDEFLELLRRARLGQHVAPIETARLHKDGTSIDVAVALSPVFDSAGQLVGLSKIVRDIRRQKRDAAELLLRDRAIQAATQGIVIAEATSPDCPLLFVSPGFERITGYSHEEALDRNCRFLQGKDTDRETVARIREAIKGGRPFSGEVLNYKKDGTPFWNELTLSPIRDDQGRLTHYVGIQSDVTQRRQLEEQYRHSQKMEAVGHLAGGVAHDFNNHLTVITGYCDILSRMLPEGGEALPLLQEIARASQRSAALTRQLLLFSRRQMAQPRVLDVNAVVADAEKMVRRLIGAHIELVTALGPLVGKVKVDPGQLEQILLNLVVNARDAMPRGGRLTIRTDDVELDEHYASLHVDARPGHYVLLTVADTGQGMPPEVKARIFEPFFTTKEAGKGTGLGLSVVHGIVQKAGGHVGVYSEVGLGTTFKVYLPRIQAPEGAAGSRPDFTQRPGGTETVLLVEDDAGVRGLALQVLRGCGYTVLEAENGAKGLEAALAHAGPIHLLLTDVVMPVMGGRELAERLLASRPATRVLFISGYADDAVFRHGIEEEKVQFLPKPFSPGALAARVRETLDAGKPDGRP